MARFRARQKWRIGPTWLHYFRNYSANVSRDGARVGFTSHGIRVRIPLLGPVTRNFTTGLTTWDSPGPGSVQFGGRSRRERN
jgi:hypothetical protein